MSPISYEEAQAIIGAQVHSSGRESIPLADAAGRVLCEPVAADRDYPPFNRAAMDGYALRWDDWQAGIRQYMVMETIYAGASSAGEIGPGQCYKIMTGAAVPPAADVLVRKEDTQAAGEAVELMIDDLRSFQHIARQGEDIRCGEKIVTQNRRCSPAFISLLASLGKEGVTVEKLPSVALFTTGNEVVPVGAPVAPTQIRNSNQYLLKALLGQWQIRPEWCAHIPDEEAALQKHFQEALPADILIVSGGVSAGDADYVPRVLEAVGAKKLFHKVAIRPGKPLWCGRLPHGGMVFALPGNPFSCFVTFTLFIQSYLQGCFGLPVSMPLSLPLQSARAKKTPLDEFFPVQITGAPAMAAPLPLNGSGDVRLGLQADALARHPAAAGDLQAGDRVDNYLL